MLLIGVSIVAFQARERTDQVRQPADLTLPAAVDQVGNEVSRRGEQLGGLLRHIRSLEEAPKSEVQDPTEEAEDDLTVPALDEEVNQSGLLPYKWA